MLSNLPVILWKPFSNHIKQVRVDNINIPSTPNQWRESLTEDSENVLEQPCVPCPSVLVGVNAGMDEDSFVCAKTL